MTEEVQTLAEVDSAPASEVTATSENAMNAPEVVENQNDSVTEEKKYSQADIDAMIGKRLAREQRKWEREQAQRVAETQIVRAAPTATVDQYESPEAYAEALAYQRAEELIAKREAAKQHSQVLESYQEREESARDKYDDFEQVAYNPKLSITNVMAETIQSSDIGPELAYYLGSNPKDAERISRMTPLSQAKEIGKIEAKLASSPPVKKTTSAPAPISPVTARSSGSPAFDTTDPRSTKTMTDSQWIEAERARQRKKWEAQNR
jgi:cytidylate kinase